MVPGHSCHISGIWTSKEVGYALKSSFGMVGGGEGGGAVFIGKGVVCCTETLL